MWIGGRMSRMSSSGAAAEAVVGSRCAGDTRSSRWRGNGRRVGAQTEETERYGDCCLVPAEEENGEGSFHQRLRVRFLKKAMRPAT